MTKLTIMSQLSRFLWHNRHHYSMVDHLHARPKSNHYYPRSPKPIQKDEFGSASLPRPVAHPPNQMLKTKWDVFDKWPWSLNLVCFPFRALSQIALNLTLSSLNLRPIFVDTALNDSGATGSTAPTSQHLVLMPSSTFALSTSGCRLQKSSKPPIVRTMIEIQLITCLFSTSSCRLLSTWSTVANCRKQDCCILSSFYILHTFYSDLFHIPSLPNILISVWRIICLLQMNIHILLPNIGLKTFLIKAQLINSLGVVSI